LFCLAWLYLLLPSLLVLAAFLPAFLPAVFSPFLSRAAGIAVLAIGLLAAWIVLRRTPGEGSGWPLAQHSTWPYLAVAAASVWLAGVLPPFAENIDWVKHYALFNELVNQSWPPVVATEGGLGTLRYSLSYYVVPALAATHAGSAWLAPAIFIWTAFGLYLVFTLAFDTRARSTAARFGVCLAFLLFSGADILGTWIVGVRHALPLHFEWWAVFGQLSSQVTSLFWTPQHALSAWLGAFLLLRYPHRAVGGGAVLAAAVAVWSPFSAIGLAPLFAWAVLKTGPRALLTRVNCVAGLLLLAAAVFFLTRGAAGRIPSGFIWHTEGFTVARWLLFLLLEVGLPAAALLLVRPRAARLVLIGCAFLLLLSLTHVGVYNDLLMRASIPALSVLAVLAADALVRAPNDLRKVGLVLCLLAGLATPLGEIARAFSAPRIAHSATLGLADIVGGGDRRIEGQYLVPGGPANLSRHTVAMLNGMRFSQFGTAGFDLARLRVESAQYADAALVSEPIALAPGLYQLEATLDWDVRAPQGAPHAAHLSLHGQRVLIPIPPSRAAGKTVSAYFYSDGSAVRLSAGLGGWSSGAGYLQLRQVRLYALGAGR